MNMAVDYNELHFLTLLIYLTADVCFFLKGYPASFYFYNQTVNLIAFRELLEAMLERIS